MEDSVNVIARHVAKTTFESLPPRVVELTKLFMLDTLGAMAAGSIGQGCKEVVDLVKEWGGTPESTVAVYGGAIPAPEAAFANSVMTHAMDLDDVYVEAVLHPSACQVPVGLAMAEREGKSGKDLLLSVALGTDIAARVAMSVYGGMGWVRSGTCNVFGAAVNAAKMLGLDENGIKHSMGIAFSQSAGNVQVVTDGAMVKKMQPGMMARAGILSAFMAGKGIRGPVGVFNGKHGFLELYRRADAFPERLTDKLGEFWENENVGAKVFVGGLYIHPPAEMVIEIVTENNIKFEDVAKLKVYLPPLTFGYVGKPFVPGDAPSVSAQFSAAYAAAAAAKHRALGVAQIQEAVVMDPEVLDLAQKRTEVVMDTTVTDLAANAPVSLDLETKDGRKFSKKSYYVKGHPKKFLTTEEFIAKFRDTVKLSVLPIPKENVERLIELSMDLENVKDASVLVKLLQPAR